MHTVAIVPPEDSPDAPAGVLTGSGDGFVLRGCARRRARRLFRPGGGGRAHRRRRRACHRTGPRPARGRPGVAPGPAEPDATSPPPPSYTLLTAGAREVLQAWRVSWGRAGFRPVGGSFNPAAAPRSAASGVRGWRLRPLVAARGSLAKPGHAGGRAGASAASVETDQQYMDVAGFAPVDGGATRSPRRPRAR